MKAPEINPMAAAMEWVSRITVVGLEMVLPGLFGQWLDAKLGTSFLVLIGFVFGLSAAMWHLIAMTRPRRRDNDSSPPDLKS